MVGHQVFIWALQVLQFVISRCVICGSKRAVVYEKNSDKIGVSMRLTNAELLVRCRFGKHPRRSFVRPCRSKAASEDQDLTLTASFRTDPTRVHRTAEMVRHPSKAVVRCCAENGKYVSCRGQKIY